MIYPVEWEIALTDFMAAYLLRERSWPETIILRMDLDVAPSEFEEEIKVCQAGLRNVIKSTAEQSIQKDVEYVTFKETVNQFGETPQKLTNRKGTVIRWQITN